MSSQECRYCGCNSKDQYRAELYDEVWQKARDMGYGNVTDALVALDRMKAAQPAAGEPVAYISAAAAEAVRAGQNAAACLFVPPIPEAHNGVPIFLAPPAAAHGDEIESLAVNRYRPTPDGLLHYKVVAGDGRRSLFTGTKAQCYLVAAKLTEAFLDGAYVQNSAAHGDEPK